jgi:hypothetical protein
LADTTIIKTISFNRVGAIVELATLNGALGSVPTIGEHYCFRLKTIAGERSNYVICQNNGATLTSLIGVVKQLVTEKQRKGGQILTSKADEKGPNADDFLKSLAGKNLTKELNATKNGKKGFANNATDPKIDGYWVKLQGWSSCSLKCGPGGTQSFQRQCIPPKNGGKPCQGEPVLTKPCNEQVPCPSTKKAIEPSPQEKEASKPIIKVMPFSNRFIKYTKCIIKETDALIVSNGENMGAKGNTIEVNIPVRIIMNNSTLTVLEGTNYDNHLFTFNLKTSKFVHGINPNCWGVEEEKPTRLEEPKRMTFCPFGLRTAAKEWVEEWDYDYNLFKYQCSSPLEHKTFNNTMNQDDDPDDDDNLNNQMDAFKADLIKEKERKMQKESEEGEIKNREEKLNGLELEAIQKEFNMEEMLEKDESQKEKDDEDKIRAEVEKEKEKRACLMKTIKEKEMENQYNMMKEESSTDLEEQKSQVKNDIIIKRNELSSKILLMRKRAARRQRKYKNELSGVKAQINDDANSAYHKGHFECSFVTGDQNYCKARFIKNPVHFGQCIKAIHNREEWCGVCCNEEIGSFYTVERTKCMNTCNYFNTKKVSADGTTIPQMRWQGAIHIDDNNALSAGKTMS